MRYLIIAILFTMAFFNWRTKANPLEPGAPAPAITAQDQEGKSVNFADIYAKGITLVYFYPRAETPGCTAQACSLRDSFAALRAKNLTILGVSEDSPEAQKKFKEKYNLPYELIADEDGKVAAAFGVPVTLGFAGRQSFIIKDGKIVWNSLRVRPATHTQEVQKALDNLKDSGTN